MKRSKIAAVTIMLTLTVCSGCPATQSSLAADLEYRGPRYAAAEFWPMAVGNYWLWVDPENPIDWYSKKVIDAQTLAGCTVYLVESTNGVGGSPVFARDFIIDHPSGLYKTSSEDQLHKWGKSPDDLSLLVPVLTGEFLKANLPYPAAYDPNREYTVAALGDLAPFDHCDADDPDIVNSGPDDFLVLPEHTVLWTHAIGLCPGDERGRITYGSYALGIGPLVWAGWRRGMLTRAVVGGYEFVL